MNTESTSAKRRLKLAFVIPWYGKDIAGGAENLCREWAEHLSGAGFNVEVLTTTIKEFQSNWNEAYHRPGEYRENGILVRRFPLRTGDHASFISINEKLLGGLTISQEEELKFLTESVNSAELVDFVASHRNDSIFFFIPYLFGTTYWGARAAGNRAVLIPCLHDESYARLSLIRELFASTGALIFNSDPEQLLAERLYEIKNTRKLVLGMGLDPGLSSDAEAFRKTFRQERPFLLYAGRKDRTKNTDLLVEYFRQYQRGRPDSPLQLLLIGKGSIDDEPIRNPQSAIRNSDVRDLGFLDAQDKYNAYAAAALLCNPSTNESFSIILMESWLCGTPVLVNSHCEVTRDYVERSKGGLHFADFYEFEACVDYLLQNPAIGKQMAASGAGFVRTHMSWSTLIQRFDTWINEVFS